MCLLDDVRLIDSEILPPPIVNTFERSIDRAHGQQVMNSVILEKISFISHGTMIVGHRWQKIRGKIVILSRLTSKSPTVPVPKEHHNVECRHSHVADIILKIG